MNLGYEPAGLPVVRAKLTNDGGDSTNDDVLNVKK